MHTAVTTTGLMPAEEALIKCENLADSARHDIARISKEITAAAERVTRDSREIDGLKEQVAQLEEIVSNRVLAEPEHIVSALGVFLKKNPQAIAEALRGLVNEALATALTEAEIESLATKGSIR